MIEAKEGDRLRGRKKFRVVQEAYDSAKYSDLIRVRTSKSDSIFDLRSLSQGHWLPNQKIPLLSNAYVIKIT